ncbi:AGAP012000-PA-like protein [Anopheles sinensis]|uniref:AGAP012000-PA-like protein n=1 Tax=Anopheles sinensis TaxID=74873 RepID=A0A084WEH5_ANOSI|nr:AGAP012000-PA-like protein [Anopheles sinensis]
MMRTKCIFFLIVIGEVLTGIGNNVIAATSDIEGLHFEMLLTHMDAFEGRIQEQIEMINEQIKTIATEIGFSKKEIKAELNEVRKMQAGMVNKIENIEGALKQITDEQMAAKSALQNIRNECTKKEAFLDMMKEQTSRLRGIEHDTVVSGMQQIIVDEKKFTVYVDSSNVHGLGGGWIIFQRRLDGTVSFNRTWTDYRDGFGYFKEEHWLGLERLYHMLKSERHELLFVLEDTDGVIAYERYDNFVLANEEQASLTVYMVKKVHMVIMD